jgi:hypothetical protein
MHSAGVPIATIDIPQDQNWIKQLKAIFFDAIFSYAGEDRADRILELSLRICGGSPDVLVDSSLTTPNLLGALNPKSGIPPLFTMLLVAYDRIFARYTMKILAHEYKELPDKSYFQVDARETGRLYRIL